MESIVLQALTAILLVALALSLLILPKWEKSPAKGISTEGVDKLDLICALVLIGFYTLGIFLRGESSAPAGPLQEPRLWELALSQVLMCLPALFVFLVRMSSSAFLPISGWKNVRLGPFIAWTLLTAFAAHFFTILYSLLEVPKMISTWLESMETQTSVQFLQNGSMELKIFIAFSAVILAPLVEELIFRGYLYPVLKKYGGFLFALIFTSLLFGLIHWNAAVLVPLALFGALLVLLYEKTKTLWVPICAHALFNLTTVVAAMSGVSSS